MKEDLPISSLIERFHLFGNALGRTLPVTRAGTSKDGVRAERAAVWAPASDDHFRVRLAAAKGHANVIALVGQIASRNRHGVEVLNQGALRGLPDMTMLAIRNARN